MIRRRHKKTREVHTELNITAFMNLMVVLIPFLLITAVFSEVTILKLNLPGSAQTEEQTEDRLSMHLEVIIRKSKLVLAERTAGVISEISFQDAAIEGTDDKVSPFVLLNQKLQILKAQAADSTTITILAESDTSYDLIIQTMDAVRMIVPPEGTDDLPGELFPDVSIGSAPAIVGRK